MDRPVRVEVREPLETVRRAIDLALSVQGVEVVGAHGDVIVWTLEDDDELGRVHPSTRVLALVDDPHANQVNQLLSAGARAVLDRASPPTIVANAAVAVARDYVVLPSVCAEATIQTLRRPEALDASEVRWMRELARGQHVARLAEVEGYSEREMYRRLSAVYRKLRVSGRAEALVALAGTTLLT